MPDIFGFQTPQETQEALMAQFQERYVRGRDSNAFQTSPGVQLGTSLGAIFGPTVKKALDTRAARREEIDRLLASGNSPEDAKARARATIQPGFAEVRRAERVQEAAKGGSFLIGQLVEQGVAEPRARAVGMLQVARQLDGNGFANEAAALRQQASALLREEEEHELKVQQAKATLNKTVDENERANLALLSNDDTFIRVSDKGEITSTKSVSELDVDERERLRAAGWINVGNSAFGVQLDQASFPGGPKPLPEAAQDSLSGGISMLGHLDSLRNVEAQTGIVRGPYNGLAVRWGWADPESGLYDAAAAHRKVRADIQSIIDGIPSEYDSHVFERTIPNPFASQSQELFNAQIDLLTEDVHKMIEHTIGFYMGTGMPVPDNIINEARLLGVNLAAVAPLTREELINVTRKHQAEMEARADMMETRRKVDEQAKTAEPIVVPGRGSIDVGGIRVIQ